MNRSPMQSARIAILVALALLFAQWVGLTHRISHAQLQAQEYSSATRSGDDSSSGNDGSAHHSCAAFDAATVGDLVHLAPFIAPLLTSAHMLASWAAFISWDAPLTRYFSSRAPPLS
jgi:hypothetical protein